MLDLNEPLNLKPESFDVIFAHLSMHYLDDTALKQRLTELYSALKPGGRIVMVGRSTEDPKYTQAMHRDGDFIVDASGKRQRFFSEHGLTELLAKEFPQLQFKKIKPYPRYIGQGLTHSIEVTIIKGRSETRSADVSSGPKTEGQVFGLSIGFDEREIALVEKSSASGEFIAATLAGKLVRAGVLNHEVLKGLVNIIGSAIGRWVTALRQNNLVGIDARAVVEVRSQMPDKSEIEGVQKILSANPNAHYVYAVLSNQASIQRIGNLTIQTIKASDQVTGIRSAVSLARRLSKIQDDQHVTLTGDESLLGNWNQDAESGKTDLVLFSGIENKEYSAPLSAVMIHFGSKQTAYLFTAEQMGASKRFRLNTKAFLNFAQMLVSMLQEQKAVASAA